MQKTRSQLRVWCRVRADMESVRAICFSRVEWFSTATENVFRHRA